MRIESSIAATQFETLTQPLLGLPISRAWCGHGSALILELGAVNGRYRSGKSRGTVNIMIRWSWRVPQVMRMRNLIPGCED
jgi:hypothetical protein